jgi:hypothetical protein
MDISAIPRFRSLEHSSISPYAEYAETQARLWAEKSEVIGDPDLFRRMRYGRCAAYAYPNASPETLAICAEWISWGFLVDDQHTRVLHLSLDEWNTVMERLQAIFSAPLSDARPDSSAFEKATVELCQRTVPLMTGAQWQRFVNGVNLYLEGMRRECVLRDDPQLTVEKYIAVRKKSVGLEFYTTLVEIEEATEIPAYIYESPTYRGLIDSISLIFAWCNDIVSYAAEEASGEINNLVVVMKQVRGLDTPAAMREARRLLEISMEHFRRLETLLPAALSDAGVPPGELDAAVRCAASLRSVTDGCLAWCMETYRYQHHLACAQGRADEHANLVGGAQLVNARD